MPNRIRILGIKLFVRKMLSFYMCTHVCKLKIIERITHGRWRQQPNPLGNSKVFTSTSKTVDERTTKKTKTLFVSSQLDVWPKV